jgi:hypothetical protein
MDRGVPPCLATSVFYRQEARPVSSSQLFIFEKVIGGWSSATAIVLSWKEAL